MSLGKLKYSRLAAMSNGNWQNTRVEVLGDDDTFRSGLVVDVADNGLFIDFCPNRRREFTPFGRIFQNAYSVMNEFLLAHAYAYTPPDVRIPLEVMVRETPSGPWAWFPAVAVNVNRGICHGASSVAVAQWMQGDMEHMDLVPLQRLRWRVMAKWWAIVDREAPSADVDSGNGGGFQLKGMAAWPEPIADGIFQKFSMLLPKKCHDVGVDQLLQHLKGKAYRYTDNGVGRFSILDIVDGRVPYIWRHGHQSHYKETDCFENGMVADRLIAVASYIRGITAPAAIRTGSLECKEIGNVKVLSSAVLGEVFSHLDTLTQTGLRTVCFAWNGILESPVLTACILITNPTPEHEYLAKRNQLHYFLTATIFKCLRPSTQHIVVDGRSRWMGTEDFLKLMEMIHYTGHQTGSRLRTIHVVGIRFQLQLSNTMDAEDDRCYLHQDSADAKNNAPFPSPNYRLVDFITGCSDLPCDAVHLVNCSIDLDYMKVDKRKEIRLSVSMPDVRLPQSGDVGCAVWDVLETGTTGTPAPNKKQLDIRSAWLASVRAHESHAHRGWVCRALCVTQSADPRPSTHHRNKQWCVDGLKDVQLEKLSAIALYFLFKLKNIILDR
ncbi:uncharacterized protein LOC129595741 isoform X2 [Paramacrobiotus metropolitanus]|uniref:uncharacterized protein LOC129595741 isoform X2 n=1 Tax=Paramacrobiotus metropolitanus TaxID=2943436 RepID=UPI002445B74F|nr:uncharacterized protein LOC129595741 isoform X2 [Paramacrobiotus metropolitanus]